VRDCATRLLTALLHCYTVTHSLNMYVYVYVCVCVTQWFHFRSSGCKGVPVEYTIENAGECAYPEGE
jgi:hypothetical protein